MFSNNIVHFFIISNNHVDYIYNNQITSVQHFNVKVTLSSYAETLYGKFKMCRYINQDNNSTFKIENNILYIFKDVEEYKIFLEFVNNTFIHNIDFKSILNCL